MSALDSHATYRTRPRQILSPVKIQRCYKTE